MIAATLDAIVDSCTALGYNVTRDYLRITDGVFSKQLFAIPNSLPILVIPFWDNAIVGHYAIPGHDGSSCTFRLTGKYDSPSFSVALLQGTERTIREPKTAEWLRRPGGEWRNGWYEDPSGMRWYSEMLTTDASTQFDIRTRVFDTLINKESDCKATSACATLPLPDHWGSKLSIMDTQMDVTSITISNGTRFGLFMYESPPLQVVKSVYDLETFISNATVTLLLFRWMVVMSTLQASYWRGKCTNWENVGIGCLAPSRGFLILPVILLPRLKNTLTAFFTLGCNFEGNQKAFSEAWFVIYPGIVELVLFYFSLLNLLARWLQRRMTDIFFGPTLLFFCVMHKLRVELSQSGWFEFDGRISTVFSAEEFDALRLTDFFTTDVALRINGNVTSMLAIKVVVLALNLVPLFVMSVKTSVKGGTAKTYSACQVETSLAIRVCLSGGLGRSSFYERVSTGGDSKNPTHVVSNYELIRLGYGVLGDRYLLTIAEWYYFLLFAPMRSAKQPSNYRVLLWEAIAKVDGYEVAKPLEHFRLNDPKLRNVHFWQLSAVCFK
ncbi:hypothetical protein Gpo141_00013379 [Globisporangium polare]